jgi:hypothetical protein
MMNGMLKALKMTCKDVYPLISESQDHSLSFFSRMRLNLHLSICAFCETYLKQLEVICRLSRSLGKDEPNVHEEISLNPEAKEKIQKWIEEKQ